MDPWTHGLLGVGVPKTICGCSSSRELTQGGSSRALASTQPCQASKHAAAYNKPSLRQRARVLQWKSITDQGMGAGVHGAP